MLSCRIHLFSLGLHNFAMKRFAFAATFLILHENRQELFAMLESAIII